LPISAMPVLNFRLLPPLKTITKTSIQPNYEHITK